MYPNSMQKINLTNNSQSMLINSSNNLPIISYPRKRENRSNWKINYQESKALRKRKPNLWLSKLIKINLQTMSPMIENRNIMEHRERDKEEPGILEYRKDLQKKVWTNLNLDPRNQEIQEML